MYTNARRNLFTWYRKNGRHDLPWRRTDDPYHIYVSEIMLQQTQVKTVLERFYFPFLEAFPTLQALADADLDDVLKQWEGLGYYSRARNLHKAARIAAPQLPQSVSELEALPGIGRSTAHAVAAFAYHTPVPILDANVKRVLHRFFVTETATEKALWELAHCLFDEARPFDYNQAMMDLGAMICTPKTPDCSRCPLASACDGKAAPLNYPAKKARKRVPVRRRIIIVYQEGENVGLYQRDGRFLSGLWGFPEYESIETGGMQELGEILQRYTHFTLEASVFRALEEIPSELERFDLNALNTLALSKADHKVLAFLGL